MIKIILSKNSLEKQIIVLLIFIITIILAFAPFLFTGAQATNAASLICIFIVLAVSYDILLGYTGIVSFAHTMFFGIGAYGVGLALHHFGPTWLAMASGIGLALAAGIVLALIIGLLSLRVRAIFFAMITLAVASAFATLIGQLSNITGGEDGVSFQLPELLRPGTLLFTIPLANIRVNGRILTYYLIFFSTLALFLAALRLVTSPFGRVLVAIRENDLRAEALGYNVALFRTWANCLAAAMAILAGVFDALWLRYVGPDTTLSFAIMLDILLMVVIGGMGTLYGAVIGATILIMAQTYLQTLMGMASLAAQGFPLLSALIHPDRWLLFLGVLFVLSVHFFPGGIAGGLRHRARRSEAAGVDSAPRTE